MFQMFLKVRQLPAKSAIWLISIYQHSLSPDHGWLKSRYPYGYCRHYPSCSQYTKEAVERFGLLKGGIYGLGRILRCNPFKESKVDPVPQQ